MERRRLADIILPARKACRLATSRHRSILVFRLPMLPPQGNRQPENVCRALPYFAISSSTTRYSAAKSGSPTKVFSTSPFLLSNTLVG